MVKWIEKIREDRKNNDLTEDKEELSVVEQKNSEKLKVLEGNESGEEVVELESVSRVDEIINTTFIGDIINGENGEGITDIGFNGTDLWIDHNSTGHAKADIQPSLEEVKRVITLIVNQQGKQLTNTEPRLNTEHGYLRVNAMHQEVSRDGMTFSIRVSRPRMAISRISEMTTGRTEEVEGLLRVLMMSGSNLLISGKVGTGKTEMQKLLVQYIDGKIVLMEDTRDSHIKQLYPEKDILSWVTRDSDNVGKRVTMQDLVEEMLRNNLDWGIIAEVRGKEAANVLDAAKSGHSIITTLHADSATQIPPRFIPMVKQSESYVTISEDSIGRDMVELLRFGMHLELEYVDGKAVRRIKEIVEYVDFKDNRVVVNHLYKDSTKYNDKTGEYEQDIKLGTLSEKTIEKLVNRKLYHELPKVFVGQE